MDLIDYQWGILGFNFHLVGFINFFLYMIMLIIYIYHVYIYDNLYEFKDMKNRIKVNEGPNNAALILIFGLIYPSIYMVLKIRVIGSKFFTNPRSVDPFVYIDLLFIVFCLLTILEQLTEDPQEFSAKIYMLIQLTFAIFKTFKSLKIIAMYSPLVTMLQKVIWGMRFFLFLFFTNVVIFTQTIKVM
jgi:hypothetical protein